MNHSKIMIFLLISTVIVFLGTRVHAGEFHVTTAAELKTALSTAQANGEADTVFLAAGTYVCDSTGGFRYNSMNGDANIILMAESGLDPSNVVLDGDNTNTLPILTIADQKNASNITVRGITIQNGISYAALELVSTGGEIIVDDCIIKDNMGNYLGAVIATAVIDLIPTGGTITFSNNTVMNNIGSVNLSAKTADITGNLIIGNTEGGGLDAGAGTVILTNNVVVGNTDGKGGGISITTADEGTIVLTNNTIVENHATNTGGGVHMLLIEGETAYFYNNIIRRNSADTAGDDIHMMMSGGGRAEGYNNNYAEIKGQWDAADGNRDLESGFVDPLNSDWHLSERSYLIDAGMNSALNLPLIDKDGNRRKIDGNEDGTEMVDIGAYEYIPPPPDDNSRGDDTSDDDDDTCDDDTCFISTAAGRSAR